ncbi:sensor histidine kinase [Paenibacillus sp. PCH8]|uniref:sensor histidine kinase n=1 Tax=Paenibacillus sp. PCH8 TaxID=2066524 RepID=UPI000CF9C2F4|nr:histidine kinase [Paenibacillus sp. PCH8]PQP80173.1 sensor histidine kinase [Paenibacillus sp. PCH8]
MKGRHPFRTNSIVFRLYTQIMVILVILFAALLLSNIYSLQVVQNHIVSNSDHTLAIYAETIHNSLDIYAKDLIEVFENNADDASDYASRYASDYVHSVDGGDYFKEIHLMNALKSKMNNNYASDGMFIQILRGDRILTQFGKRVQSSEKMALSDFLKQEDWKVMQTHAGKRGEWSVLNVEGTFYLFKHITYGAVSFGTFVKADSLLSLTSREADPASQFVLSAQDGHILAATVAGELWGKGNRIDEAEQSDKRYLFVTKSIEEFGQMTNVVTKQSMFSGLKLIQWLIISLGGISLIAVPLVLRFLARNILRPILELVRAAKEVEKGQLPFPEAKGNYSFEFMKLFHSFQSMVHEITHLKIQSYEEKIEKSRAELKVLQMQIRPHFYLNAISTISSLTYHNRNEEIRQMIQMLSRHLRYMFKPELTLVSIDEEMRHVENYIRMQEIRYPDQIFYMTDIEPTAGPVRIPQLLIQTFVENMFKYALTYGELLSIFIRANVETLGQQSYVQLVIEDNGEGFPESWLERFESGDLEREDGEQIGIATIYKTLKLLYKQDALLTLSNAESSGAKIEVWLPIPNESQNTTG